MDHWEPVYRGTPTSNLYLENSQILPIGDPVPCNEIDLLEWTLNPGEWCPSLQGILCKLAPQLNL